MRELYKFYKEDVFELVREVGIREDIQALEAIY